MVTKGIIVSVPESSDSNIYKVRLPFFEDPIENAEEMIYESTLNESPGILQGYEVGDVVYCTFEDNNMARPVIIGRLFSTLFENVAAEIETLDLDVTNRASLPKHTTIGNATEDDVARISEIKNKVNKMGDTIFGLMTFGNTIQFTAGKNINLLDSDGQITQTITADDLFGAAGDVSTKVSKSGDTMTGDLNFSANKGINFVSNGRLYWKENGWGDQFAITPDFTGGDDSNKLKIQSAVGGRDAEEATPSLTDKITIAGKTGSVNMLSGNLTLEQGNVWAGTLDDTTAERDVGVRSGAGNIYLYSTASATGNRGLYTNAHGTGSNKAIIQVDTNNNITYASGTVSGLLNVNNLGNTVTIGSQNNSWCHIYNSANVPFIFNKTVATTSGDLGTDSYAFTDEYLKGQLNFNHKDTTHTANTMYHLVNLKFNNEAGTKLYTTYPISYIGTDGTDGFNTAIRLGSTNGTTWVTSGESGTALPTALRAYNDEKLYLSSDASIELYTNVANDGSSYQHIASLNSGNFGINGTATVSGDVTITEGKDLVLKANSSASSDPGDLVFQANDGSEVGRIYKPAGSNYFLVRYNTNPGTPYKIITSQNITYGTGAPSGGEDGDIYIQYTA